VLIRAATALAVLQFSDPDWPWQGALMMTAAAHAVTSPHYQWYSLLLVMLVALDGRPEWLAFAAGAYYAAEPSLGRYTPPWRLNTGIGYGVPLLIVAAGWLIRHELAGRAVGAGPLPTVAEPTVAERTVAEPTPTVAAALRAEAPVPDAGPDLVREPGPGLVRQPEPDPAFAADAGREVPV